MCLHEVRSIFLVLQGSACGGTHQISRNFQGKSRFHVARCSDATPHFILHRSKQHHTYQQPIVGTHSVLGLFLLVCFCLHVFQWLFSRMPTHRTVPLIPMLGHTIQRGHQPRLQEPGGDLLQCQGLVLRLGHQGREWRFCLRDLRL